jgi:hypothetical protein
MFNSINIMLTGTQRMANPIVTFNHSLGILARFYLGMSSIAWFFDTNGNIGLIKNR